MQKNTSSLMSVFLILLCFNSIVYYDIQNNTLEDDTKDLSRIEEIFETIINDNRDSSYSVKKALVPGNSETKAFFSYKSVSPSLDNGSSYEWTEYDSIPGHDGYDLIRNRFGWGDITNGVVPSEDDAYYLGSDYWYSDMISVMYSPVFSTNTTISDKAHYIFNMHRDLNDDPYDSYFNSIDITFKIALWHYESTTNLSSEITSVEALLPKINTPSDTEYWSWLTWNDSFTSFTIPAGDRLKVTYEIAYSDVGAVDGHCTLNVMADGEHSVPGSSMDWDIDDGVHSNSYSISNVDGILGVQLYMREEIFPDIDISGVTNNTVYQSQDTITIDVTDGSDSYYRWDGGSWIPFDSNTTTQVSATHGWHYLEVSANETLYNNTRTELLKIGYDSSYDNLILNNAFSGEKLPGGFVLNFSTINVNSTTYAWDGSETPIVLNSPYDITTSLYNGLHNLTINTTDFYKTRIFNYQFYFDSDSPTLQLDNVANNTFLLGGKTIEIEILDYSDLSVMNYSWDSGSIQNWVEEPSNIYDTTMPTANGSHYLDIYIEDEFNHNTTERFVFYTDVNVFFVDLKYMNNDSYYLGGNDVELIIQQSNTTVYYAWNNGSETKTDVLGEILLLTGGDVLPNSEGLHNLTIRSFDIFDVSYNYIYFFYVDKTAPVIDSSILDYNNTRTLKEGVSFTFFISDESIPIDDILVQYSFDSQIYDFFDTRFVFPLFSYGDGLHSLDILVEDKAGNQNITRIYFTIDTMAPEILDIDIPDMITIVGNDFVPGDTYVEVLTDDEDPGYTVFYSWNGSAYQLITGNNFTLSSSVNEKAYLEIYANDTLGNFVSESILLIYDGTAPSIFKIKPSDNVHINNRTSLEFNVEEISEYKLDTVQYEWVGLTGLKPITPKPYGDFDFIMDEVTALLCYYLPDPDGIPLSVQLSITATDIFGNSTNEIYDFVFDVEEPTISLFIIDIVNLKIEPNGTAYEVQGGTGLWYNSSVNDDLDSFTYYWDDYDENGTELITEFDLVVPDEDGNHTLYVTLKDKTGEGDRISHNVFTAFFNFTVDDITVGFQAPFYNDYEHMMLYNDTFSYVVKVTDPSSGLEIPGLQTLVEYYDSFNLSITVVSINSTSYNISIHALDVTNYRSALVHVRFYQASPIGGQVVSMSLRVDKKEGSMEILSKSNTSVQYGEDFEVYLSLQDSLSSNQTINRVIVNQNDILDFEFNITMLECNFNYSSSDYFSSKGNYSLTISVESLYYYDNSTVSTELELEVLPIPVLLTVWVSNTTILEGQSVEISANLTYIDGSPIPFETIDFFIYVYYKNDTILTPTQMKLAFTDWNYTESDTDATNLEGTATITFTLDENIAYIGIEANFSGTFRLDLYNTEFDSFVITYPPIIGGLPQWLLYTIIGGSIALAVIVSYIIYKLTRPKSFEELMEKVTIEDIALNYSIMSPGVVLTIFDQRKGPIPLIGDHSLDIGRYIGRMRIGVENFLLKIADQAYSSLGFEEHDTARRVGSIILPTEKMTGFVHGLQLDNKMARGGFENLSLIVLADTEYGSLLLNYQEHLYDEVDEMISYLKSKKPLKEIEELVKIIRRKSVIIMLAAQVMEAQQGTE